MKNPTTAIITPYFPPQGGGLERYAYEVATRLVHKGMPVVVITSGVHGQDSVETLDGLKVYRLGYRFKISNTPFAFSWFSKIKEILKHEHIDVINVHMPVAGIGDVATIVAGHRPVIVTYHTGPMKKGSFFADLVIWTYEHLMLPLLLNRAQHIVATSTFVARFVKRSHKTTIVTPAVNSEQFVPGPKAAKPTVLFVGGLSRAEGHKGLTTFLEAAHLVAPYMPDLELDIVGEGNMQSEYEAQARELGLVARFNGRLQGSALVARYARAHALVLPTTNDNFPITLLEAAAAGTPTISTTVGSIADIIDDGRTGHLIVPRDSRALAKKILHVFQYPDRAQSLSDAARRKALVDFAWTERIECYAQILLQNARTIVHVSAYYPPHLGGVERVVETAAHMQAQAGNKVVVLAANSHALTTIEHLDAVTIARLASVELAHTPFAPTLIWWLMRLPRNSLIHVHLAQAYWADLVWLVAPLRRIPYIVHFHLDVEPSGIFGFLFLLYKKVMWGPILRGARRVLVCSPAQVPLVERYGVRQDFIDVVPNGVGQEFFSSRSYAAPEGGLRLLSVGRLAPQKSLGRLIEMMAHLTIPAHLTIVGNGEESTALERSIKQKNLTNISLVGGKSAPEVRAYHAHSDVFVISSQKEGLPLSVLEAMAAGLPVVATNVMGLAELLHGVGVLVDEPFPQNMARALESLGRNKSLLEVLSIRSRQKATEFVWPRFYEALTHAYDKVLR